MERFVDWIKKVFKKSKKEKTTKALAKNIGSHMFEQIASGICPECAHDHKSKGGFLVIARGGVALNVECDNCRSRYYVAPLPMGMVYNLKKD